MHDDLQGSVVLLWRIYNFITMQENSCMRLGINYVLHWHPPPPPPSNLDGNEHDIFNLQHLRVAAKINSITDTYFVIDV